MINELQNWLVKHAPSKEYLYEKEFWAAYIMLRDKVCPLFTAEHFKKRRNFAEFECEIANNVSVVGSHMSKSILNPVVKIDFNKTSIVLRYNFYDYEVVVNSPHPIRIPMNGLFSSKEAVFYFQGFPEEYKTDNRYENDKCVFAAHIEDQYQLYTFMYMLRNQI